LADYQKMYYALMDAVERALMRLEQGNVDIEILRPKVIEELVAGEILEQKKADAAKICCISF